MSDNIPKCPTCKNSKNMHLATFAKNGVYVEEWLCLTCDKQNYAFKDMVALNKIQDRDE